MLPWVRIASASDFIADVIADLLTDLIADLILL